MDERIIKNKTKKKILIILITTALLITSFSTVTGNTTTSNEDESEKYNTNTEYNFHTYNDENDLNYVPDNLIIKFKENFEINKNGSFYDTFNTGIPSLDSLNTKYNAVSQEKLFINSDNSEYLSNHYKLTFSKENDMMSLINDYQNLDYVEYAEPNYEYNIYNVPNDPRFSSQWSLNQNNDCDIDAPEAWDIETGSSEVVVAVVDTGVDYNHPDLAANCISGYDFINNDDDPMDDHNHGTHCAGIIGAIGNNNLGISGVSWDVSIMPVKCLSASGSGSSQTVSQAINYAANNGADVISMSLGGGYSQVMEDAVDYAYSKDVVIVAAAGNSDTNAKHYPAGFDKVIAVAATDQNDDRAHFSNYGNWVDLAAPGVSILSTLRNDNYGSYSGTSMACPHVSGLAALILTKDPTLPNNEVKTILVENTDNINTDQYVGSGRINAQKCLEGTPSIFELTPENYEARLEQGEAASTTFEIWTDRSSLDFYIQADQDWISVSPNHGTLIKNEVEEITVTINTNGLLNGSYKSNILIITEGLGSETFKIDLTIGTVLSFTPESDDVCLKEGEQAKRSFEIWNSGVETLNYHLSKNPDFDWITLSETDGTSTGEHDKITIDIDTTGVSNGWHTCEISIESNGGNDKFTLNVGVGAVLAYSPKVLNLGRKDIGDKISTSFNIWNKLGRDTQLDWSMSTESDWISFSPTSGISTGEKDIVTVEIDTSKMTGCGNYNTPVKINTNGGNGEVILKIETVYRIISTTEECMTTSRYLMDYDEARDLQRGCGYSSSSFNVGQTIRRTATNKIDIYRSFLYFNTTDIPSNAEIGAGALSLYSLNTPDTVFDIVIQNGQPSHPQYRGLPHPHDIAGWDPNNYPYPWYFGLEGNVYWGETSAYDYDRTNYHGDGGRISTSDFESASYTEFDLSNDGLNWITKNGMTKLCLRSSQDIEGIEVGNNDYSVMKFANRVPDVFHPAAPPILTLKYGQAPNRPDNPNPVQNAENVELPVELSVEVSDPDGNSMRVTFYDASDDSVIGVDENVLDGGRATVKWDNLCEGKKYSWYAVADDDIFTTQSRAFSFTTKGVPSADPDNDRELDQLQVVYDQGFQIGGDCDVGQEFIPTMTPLDSIDLYLCKSKPKSNLIIELREGSIDGTIVDTVTFSPTQIDEEFSWVTVDFDDVQLNIGEPYYIIAKIETVNPGSIASSYLWGFTYNNFYEQGDVYLRKTGSEDWNVDTERDCMFKTFAPDDAGVTAALSFNPDSHDFGEMNPGNIRSTNFEIWNSGTGTLSYTLSESEDWLTVTPENGDSTGEHDTIDVEVDTTGLTVGEYHEDIIINSNGGNSVFSIDLTVTNDDINNPPEIVNEKPEDGATLTSKHSANLQVSISDPDGDLMDLTFYDGDYNVLNEKTGLSDGSYSFKWEGLEANTTYSWYAIVTDSKLEDVSGFWSFTTADETTTETEIQINFKLLNKNNLTVEIQNDNDYEHENINIVYSVKSKFLSRVNVSNETSFDLLEANGKKTFYTDEISSMFALLNINVNVTVNGESFEEDAFGIKILKTIIVF